MRVNVGVAGCGIGSTHIRVFKSMPDLFSVSALCDVDVPRAQSVAATEGIEAVTEDFSELCRRDDVDVVDICTPSYLHVSQILHALSRGKQVICEKPVAGSLQDLDTLMEAESRSGRSVMPIFQNRFGTGVQKLKYLVEHGVTGRAYVATSETAWRRRVDYYSVPWRGKWETELGGPLVTLAIHALDLVQFIVSPAKRVSAFAATRVNTIETEDCIVASLQMSDDSLCSLSVTTGSAEQISRLRFSFEALSAESNADPYDYPREPWRIKGDTRESEELIEDTLRDFRALPEGFTGQFLLFHQALENGTRLPVTLADARASLETITAIYRSVRTAQPADIPVSRRFPEYRGWHPKSVRLRNSSSRSAG